MTKQEGIQQAEVAKVLARNAQGAALLRTALTALSECTPVLCKSADGGHPVAAEVVKRARGVAAKCFTEFDRLMEEGDF